MFKGIYIHAHKNFWPGAAGYRLKISLQENRTI